MCDMTHPHVCHDSFMCDMTHPRVWHDSFTSDKHQLAMRGTWLVHKCYMTRSHVWHDSCSCVTWLVHMCDMTRSNVWHDSFTCVTWLIQMYMNESCHTRTWVMSHIWMAHATHAHESCHTYEWVMPHTHMSHVTQSTYTCSHHIVKCASAWDLQGGECTVPYQQSRRHFLGRKPFLIQGAVVLFFFGYLWACDPCLYRCGQIILDRSDSGSTQNVEFWSCNAWKLALFVVSVECWLFPVIFKLV